MKIRAIELVGTHGVVRVSADGTPGYVNLTPMGEALTNHQGSHRVHDETSLRQLACCVIYSLQHRDASHNKDVKQMAEWLRPVTWGFASAPQPKTDRTLEEPERWDGQS